MMIHLRFRCVRALPILVAGLCGCGVVAPGVPATVPDFDAATFTDPTSIDNRYFPQLPGATRTYEAETEDGTEQTVIDVLEDTREVLGIECRVVRDRVYLDDVLIEDTHDWFAQDDEGNVWYMGEEVDNYNYDDQGMLIDITHEGAWEAGKDIAQLGTNARAGHVMLASPMQGDVYHQEFYEGEAEDLGRVVALDVTITLAGGQMYTCLQTLDTTALDPDSREHKYYAPGIGMVVEESVGGGERAELVDLE